MTPPFSLSMLIISTGVVTGLLVGGIMLLRNRLLFVTVRGNSMAPTLQPQDHVLVWRLRAAKQIDKGTIVLLDTSVARHLPRLHGPFMKRVVAVAGETYTDPGVRVPLEETRRWEIPAGMVFVCGDHLEGSYDSRAWGPVPLSVITGVVIYHFKR